MPNKLYTFRRCPYAIRARYAIALSSFICEQIQIDLKNKSQEFLDISPKGTVPVLVTESGEVIDESLDIIKYVFTWNDTHGALEATTAEGWFLIQENDTSFKKALDRYKYPNRFEPDSETDWLSVGEGFISKLNALLKNTRYLCGENISVADIAIFPFIRQYRGVNIEKFDNRTDYSYVQNWLNTFLESETFQEIMKKV